MAKIGRPTAFSAELSKMICNYLALGKTVAALCRENPDLPAEGTIFRWVGENDAFRADYARARVQGCEAVVDHILEISDDGSKDMIEKTDKRGRTFQSVDQENVARSRLRVDTRKWYLSKIVPKIFGDNVRHEITGAEGGPILLDTSLRVAKLDALYAAVQARLETGILIEDTSDIC